MIARRPRAFTLIEMLVVISIIALLIAILLPALLRARDSANEVQCLSNMSMLMKAQTNYAIDADGYFAHPHEWIWGGGRGGVLPENLPSWYTGSNWLVPAADYTSDLAPLYGTLNPYVPDTNAHFCPVAPEMPVNGLKTGTNPMGDSVVRSYVQNSLIGPEQKYAKLPVPKYTTIETIKSPAELLFLTEENTFIMNFESMSGISGGAHPMNDGMLDLGWDSIGSIHRRKDRDNLRSGYASTAFADGHADWAFSQATSPGTNIPATKAFADDEIENPEGIEDRFIDESMDFSFTY